MSHRNQEWALDVLYGEEVRDFSADAFILAMHELGRRNPALAKRVARALQPIRDQVFPRRRIPWHETSIGRRYRLALLPDNPHFRQDVAVVRGALGLPEDQIGCEGDNPIRVQLAKSPLFGEEGDDLIQSLAVRVLARRWLALHQETFCGSAPSGTTDGLTPGAIAAARRTELVLDGLEGTDWLQAEPPAHPDCLWDGQLPLHLAAVLLLERHRLPRHICPSVMIHILTKSRDDLLGLEPEQVLTFKDAREIRVEPPSHTISVLVQGIDEYTTKADWDRIWNERVEPVLEEFWEERGQRPRGRRALGLNRLTAMLPLYESFLKLGSIDQALVAFQHVDMAQKDPDQETARRLIRDLRELLEPGFASVC